MYFPSGFKFRKLNLDLVPRIDGEVIEGDTTSVVELFQVHLESSKRISRARAKTKSGVPVAPAAEKRMSIYGTLSKRPPALKTPSSHHLFMAFKSFMCNIGEAATLFFGLYDKTTGSYIRCVYPSAIIVLIYCSIAYHEIEICNFIGYSAEYISFITNKSSTKTEIPK